MSIEDDVRKMREMIEDLMDAIDEETRPGEYDRLDTLYAEAEDLLREVQ